MPIYPRTYHHWEGPLGGPIGRLRAFATVGIAVAWRNRWLRRVMILAWMPVAWFALAFFVTGQILQQGEAGRDLLRGLAVFVGPGFGRMLGELREDEAALWATLFYVFLGIVQRLVVLLVVAMVGPGLIASDVRHQAHEVYFARPVGWTDYLAGKLVVVAFFVALITLAPALALYLEAVLVSPSIASLGHTLLLPPRLVLVWIVWAIGLGLPILALSSLSTSSRLTAFLWIGLWIGSWLLAQAVRFAWIIVTGTTGGDPDAGSWSDALSLQGNLMAVAYGILGIGEAVAAAEGAGLDGRAQRRIDALIPGHSPWVAAAVLLGVAIVSLLVLRARVRPEGAA